VEDAAERKRNHFPKWTIFKRRSEPKGQRVNPSRYAIRVTLNHVPRFLDRSRIDQLRKAAGATDDGSKPAAREFEPRFASVSPFEEEQRFPEVSETANRRGGARGEKKGLSGA